MRLIDADEFLILESAAYVEAQAKTSDKITRLVNEVVHKKLQMLVSDAPTAYDVDKVLEQLEYCRVPNTGIAGYHKVVEIVKRGAVDEK